MKNAVWIAAALAVGVTVPVQAEPTAAMTKAGCTACHAQDKKMIGPSYDDVAAKYAGQDVVEQLAAKVRSGGKGVWGPIPMPPHSDKQISDEDLTEAIKTILGIS